MEERPEDGLETDTRFPSGPWVGFWIQKISPKGRHSMELRLTFRAGVMQGEGRDWIAPFLVTGRYELVDGRCHWTKRYIGKHDVFYNGFNEGKGIWGVWEIADSNVSLAARGGFHIWPEGMPDPSEPYLTAVADVEQTVEAEEAVPVTSARE